MLRDQELAGLAMTLGRDAKITITVDGDTSFCKPDGSHINIARMPSTPLGRMLMIGLVFHEIGHKNFTKGGRPQGFLGDMMNVIEDIRVDRETIKNRPGTCFNLEAITTHYQQKGSLDPQNIAQAVLGKVMAYGYGRVLQHKAIHPLETVCDEMMDDAFGTEFILDVEKIIKGIPRLKSTKDVVAMAQRLVDLLIEQQNKGAQQQSGTASASTSAGKGGGKRPTAAEIEELLNNNSGYGDRGQLMTAELDRIADAVPSSVKAGIPVLPRIGRLHPTNGKLHEVAALAASSRMRARMMGLLHSMKRMPASFGLSGRRIAPERLVKLATGDPRIFRKKVENVEVNTAVALLLDLSGSMSGRYEVANAAAFALHTTLFGLQGVAACSLEFSGKDHEPDVSMLVDFGRKPLSEQFNHRPFDGTPTDTAIWAARAVLLQRKEPRRILLLLTDGGPDCGMSTKAATVRSQKDGIEIAAIGIMDTSVQRYWANHQVIESIEELPAAMFGVMERLLTRKGVAA